MNRKCPATSVGYDKIQHDSRRGLTDDVRPKCHVIPVICQPINRYGGDAAENRY